MKVRGWQGSVSFDGERVTVSRWLRGRTTIPVSRVGAVEIVRAGVGFWAIRFSTGGGTLEARRAGRTRTVPVFTVIRSTKEEPGSIPAASPRLPRSTSPWSPGPPPKADPGVPRPITSRYAPLPAPIHQI